MTQLEILNLAYTAQVNIWAKEDEHAKALIENEFANARAEKAWNKLKELERMIREEEEKGE